MAPNYVLSRFDDDGVLLIPRFGFHASTDKPAGENALEEGRGNERVTGSTEEKEENLGMMSFLDGKLQ
jgi:hypothetical protein